MHSIINIFISSIQYSKYRSNHKCVSEINVRVKDERKWECNSIKSRWLLEAASFCEDD